LVIFDKQTDKRMLIAEKSRQRNKAKAIPESLIYEIIDGKPFYYDGYKDVLANKKTSEEIMGASGFQSFIIYYLLKVLYAKLVTESIVF